MGSTKESNIKIRTRGRRFAHDAEATSVSRLLTGLVRTSHGLVLNFAKNVQLEFLSNAKNKENNIEILINIKKI